MHLCVQPTPSVSSYRCTCNDLQNGYIMQQTYIQSCFHGKVHLYVVLLQNIHTETTEPPKITDTHTDSMHDIFLRRSTLGTSFGKLEGEYILSLRKDKYNSHTPSLLSVVVSASASLSLSLSLSLSILMMTR